jgi:acetate kinase
VACGGYGFHGLSYEYIADVLPQFDPKAGAGRTVVAHLGNGSSMCAMVNGRSMASTMGFTCGGRTADGDALRQSRPRRHPVPDGRAAMDARAIETLIYKQSGLLGVSGESSDMRTLLASDDARARFAVNLYVYRIGRELGSLAAAAGGIDALVFTAGSASMRR